MFILLQDRQPTVPAAAVINSNSSDNDTSVQSGAGRVLQLKHVDDVVNDVSARPVSDAVETDSDSDSSNYFRLRMVDNCHQSAASTLIYDDNDDVDVAQTACWLAYVTSRRPPLKTVDIDIISSDKNTVKEAHIFAEIIDGDNLPFPYCQ